MLGVPTGFDVIDEATAGLQGGQLVTVIAPPKTGKSQIALAMAIHTHSNGNVPMFQSFEMTNREQQQRHDSIRSMFLMLVYGEENSLQMKSNVILRCCKTWMQ